MHSKTIIEKCAPILSANKILLPSEINTIIHQEHLARAAQSNVDDVVQKPFSNTTYVSYTQEDK